MKVEKFLEQQDFLPIQQALVWGEFQESLGWKVFRIGVEEGGELIAFTQVFERQLPLGLKSLQISRGPLGDPAAFELILEEVEKLGKQRGVVFARFDFQKDLEANSPDLRKAKEENFPQTTLVLDLTQSEEELLKNMKQKGRYNIRVATKHGVEIQEEKDVAEFYQILKKTTSRDGFSAHPESYYQKFLQQLGKNTKLLIARKDGKAIAGIILTFAGDTATYYYGASDHEFRQYMAPYLLQFEAMKIAKAAGYRFYDFLGIAPEDSKNHHLAGVSNFKRKFGGEIVQYPQPKELVLKPFIHKLFKLIKKLR